MAFTTYLDQSLLQHAVGKTAYPMPANYAALFTAGVRTILMQDAGHFLHVEKPPAFNDHVLEFLQA